jgi:GrpB-like predicted nucleotidyltransferase (UPF0157 family)
MPDAPIEIVEYSPQWPLEFAREQQLVSQALAPWLVGLPQHIGSTAVPGLAAKPIIDIMAPVASLEASAGRVAAAERIGYVFFPYKPEVMHWFCKPSPAHRTHHLHLVPMGSRLWKERLAFRDALRAHAELRSEYQALKQRLAAEHRGDREAYTEGKSAFVARVVNALLGPGESAA